MPYKNNKVCQKCGKQFAGGQDFYYCRDCASELKADVLRERICSDCGVSFADKQILK